MRVGPVFSPGSKMAPYAFIARVHCTIEVVETSPKHHPLWFLTLHTVIISCACVTYLPASQRLLHQLFLLGHTPSLEVQHGNRTLTLWGIGTYQVCPMQHSPSVPWQVWTFDSTEDQLCGMHPSSRKERRPLPTISILLVLHQTQARLAGYTISLSLVIYLDILILLYVPSLDSQLTGWCVILNVLHWESKSCPHSAACTGSCGRLIFHLPKKQKKTTNLM